MEGSSVQYENFSISNVLFVNWMPPVGCAAYCRRVRYGGYMNVKECKLCVTSLAVPLKKYQKPALRTEGVC